MKYEVNIAELADHFVIVLKDKETRQVKKAFTLNHLGTDILRAYMEDKPQEELAPVLAERYKASLESMQQQVSRFYKDLASRMKLVIVVILMAVTMQSWAQKFIFTPQWSAQAQFAGYYVAKEKGFYREAGLDVDIIHPSVSLKAIDRIQRNKSNATTLQLAEAIEMVAQGIPLVNILQTSMNNAMVIVSRRGVDPLTQKGARVGIWNAGFGQLAQCMSIKEGLYYDWVKFSSNVSLFVTGALDATLAMSYNEYYQLLQTGMTLNEKNVYRFCEHGYNVQEDGVYMTKAYYEQHRDQARRFAEASKKGWLWAVDHPDETLDIVMDYVKRNKVATNRVLQKLMLQEVLRLQVDRESGKREFRLRPDMVRKASLFLKVGNMIDRTVTYEELIAR